MSLRTLPDKKLANKKVWNIFQLPYNKIVGQLFSYNIFKWADKKLHVTIKNCMFPQSRALFGAFCRICSIWLKWQLCRNRAQSTENGPFSIIMADSNLVTWKLPQMTLRKLDEFKKITEKLALPCSKGIFTHFGRFPNFCKSALFLSKNRREIH